MKKRKIINLLYLFLFSLFFYSCASSTGSRYSKSDTEKKVNSSNNQNLVEDFDISPYKTKIEVPEKSNTKTIESNDVWYDYNSPSTNSEQKVLIGTQDGYRVLITSTDNLEDANQIKSDISNTVNDNEVYIDFEPPFYKVKAGDFDSQKTADNLRFKLNQLGYTEAKVIKETINVFK
jgi:hypothetical protein